MKTESVKLFYLESTSILEKKILSPHLKLVENGKKSCTSLYCQRSVAGFDNSRLVFRNGYCNNIFSLMLIKFNYM